jgi:predicted hydrocarbon binding protein
MTITDTKTVPTFGYELIRDHVLSTILGKHEDDILYWAGKDLARKFQMFSIEETTSFFEKAGWGLLTLDRLTKDEAFFTLTGEPDALQINKRCFRLEAGFLAQQQQKLGGFLTECFEEKFIKKNIVQFHVKWDLKEKIQ